MKYENGTNDCDTQKKFINFISDFKILTKKMFKHFEVFKSV